MDKLYGAVFVIAVMLALVPVSPELALQPAPSRLPCHFVYMFAHANILHWAVNSWALLALHNTFRWHRLLAAYLLAVLISFFPLLIPAGRPVMGASVITTFFFGLIITHYWRHDRLTALMMTALLLVSCVLPGFAAFFHIVPFLVGLVYYRVEGIVRSFISFSR